MTGSGRAERWCARVGHACRFVETPHHAIDGNNQGEIVNLTDVRAKASRDGQLELLQDYGPDRIVQELTALKGMPAPIEAESVTWEVPSRILMCQGSASGFTEKSAKLSRTCCS